MDFTINFLAVNLLVVLSATTAGILLGGLWYSPVLFGKVWHSVSQLPATTGQNGASAGVFVSSFILQFIAASLLAALLGPNAGGTDGLQLGLLIGFGFVFTAVGITNLFEHRSLLLIFINAGYHIASFGLIGYIIGHWS